MPEETGREIAARGSVIDKRVLRAKREQQIRRIKRQGSLSALNDWVGFGVSKAFGFASLVIGALEWIDPTLLTIELKRPEIFAGVGLALLTGRSIVSLIAKLDRAKGT
jgi:hypothetical protein